MGKFVLFWIAMLSFVFYGVAYPVSQKRSDGQQVSSHCNLLTNKILEKNNKDQGSSLYFHNKRCRFPKDPEKDWNILEQAIVMVKTTIVRFKKMFINT